MTHDDRTADRELAAVDRAAVTLAQGDHVLVPIDAEVTRDVRPGDVVLGLVGAGHPVPTATHRVIREDRHVLPQTLRADVALREPSGREVGVLEPTDRRREQQPLHLGLLHLPVAREQDRDGLAARVEQHRLQRPFGRHIEQRRDRVDRRGVRRVDLLERRGPVPGGGVGRPRGRGLPVGQVVAVHALDEQVLADVRARHELVVHAPADLTRLGVDHDVRQPASVEDPSVCPQHHVVGRGHALLVPVERIGVLHQELATTQEPESRAELIPVLPLDLVQVHGQVSVRGEVPGDELGHDLLLRGTEQQLALVAVPEPKERVAVQVPPAGGLPRVGGQQDRHPELLRARRVHLLADDPFDLADRPETERQRGVDAGGDLPHERRAQEEPMRRDLRLGGIVTQRRREHGREPHGGPGYRSRSAPSCR